jgi:hypothetical protein
MDAGHPSAKCRETVDQPTGDRIGSGREYDRRTGSRHFRTVVAEEAPRA